MQKAKQAVSDFVSRDGHHTTTVSEDVNQAVTKEHINPHRHEEVQHAVDKEVHQDHHMTTVQPVVAHETLPEQHVHNVMPTKHKTFEHDNSDGVRAKLQQEASKFRDERVTADTTHSTSAAATVQGERVHHHVHEHVQPVIEKQVDARQVVHTTVPVHETHHAATQHHGTKVLPAKSLDEFKSSGGILHSKAETRVGEHDGCPEPTTAFNNHHNQSAGSHVGHNHGSSTTAGPHSSNLANKADPRVDSDMDGRGIGRSGENDLHRRNEGSGYSGVHTTQTGAGNTVHSHTDKKENGHTSLLDKLNPLK